MKQDITKYISECDICGRVKADHMRRPGFLQPLPIPIWKWEDISMDFVMGLPRTAKGYDSIWVIVDSLTKSAHFFPVDIRYSAKKYAKLYFDRVVILHGVSLTIVSGPSLSLASRSNSRNVLVLFSSEVQLIIRKLTVRQKGSIKYLKTC